MTTPQTSRPRLTVIVWWYLATFVASAALIGVQMLTHVDPMLISLVQFAPTIALLAIPQARRAAIACVKPQSNQAFTRSLVLTLLVAALFVTGMVMVAAITGTLRIDAAFGSIPLLVLYFALQFVGAMGEEIGWRGFLQPALETRMNRAAAAVCVGVMWAVWHVQMFTSLTIGLLFTLSCVAMSLVFAWCARGSVAQRALIGGVLHFVVNVSLVLTFAGGESLIAMVVVPAAIAALGAGVVGIRAARGRTQRQLAQA